MAVDQQLYSDVQPAVTFFQNVIILTSSHRSLVNHHDIISDVIMTSYIQ